MPRFVSKTSYQRKLDAEIRRFQYRIKYHERKKKLKKEYVLPKSVIEEQKRMDEFFKSSLIKE